MAIKIFTGNAALVTDVWTFTVVTYADTTVLGITCNGKTVSITLAGSGYTAATAAAARNSFIRAKGRVIFRQAVSGAGCGGALSAASVIRSIHSLTVMLMASARRSPVSGTFAGSPPASRRARLMGV